MEILQGFNWPGNVRELQNLIESMVVLAPGKVIRAEDIPDEVRFGSSKSSLLPAAVGLPPLPAPMSAPQTAAAPITGRPELEFVFRTLVDLRVDMDELKREFDAYRRGAAAAGPPAPSPYEIAIEPTRNPREVVYDSGSPVPTSTDGVSLNHGEISDTEPPNGEGVVVFRPGMSMDDLEKLAIESALEHTGGNRRKAAEELGIGERTLYRKIQRYGLQ